MPALDGMRGIAVAAVVAFHLGLSWVPGGLLGVDVFFVLSGFLITGLLLTEWRRTGAISLTAFWGRRARRLLPALLLLLPALVIVWRLTADPSTLAGVRDDAIATLLYVANWHSSVAGHGYFDAFAAPSPLLHTWSLAVEEQFYILWPLVAVVVLARRRSPVAMLGVCVGGAVASAGLMAGLAIAGVGPDRLYYGTDTRAQALLAGGALACVLHVFAHRDLTGRRWDESSVGLSSRAQHWLGATGVFGAVGLMAFFLSTSGTDAWLYRGGFALVAACCVALIAAVTLLPDSALSRLVSVTPLAALGRISYGVYLWHWPIIVLLTHERTGVAGTALILIRVTVTLAVSVLSYVLLEAPIRSRRIRIPRPAFAVPGLVMALTAALVLTPLPTVQGTTLDALQSASAPAAPPAAPLGTVDLASSVQLVAANSASHRYAPAVTRSPLRVMLMGDSVAYSLGLGLPPSLTSSAGIAFSAQGYVGCGIASGGLTSFRSYTQPTSCLTWDQRWKSLVDTFRPDVSLVLLGRWEVLDRVHDGRWMHIGQPAFDRYLKHQLEVVVKVLTSRGGRIAFLSTPCNDSANDTAVAKGTFPADDNHRVALFNQLISGVVAAHPGRTELVPFASLICPQGKFVRTMDGVGLRTSDGIHLQTYAGLLFVRRQLPAIIRWMRKPSLIG